MTTVLETGWTVDRVKAELPDVRVRWNGKLYQSRVTGRANQFASVSPHIPIDNAKRVRTIMGPIFHFSWETVARGANGAVLECGDGY